jgi:hypothetical protein
MRFFAVSSKAQSLPEIKELLCALRIALNREQSDCKLCVLTFVKALDLLREVLGIDEVFHELAVALRRSDHLLLLGLLVI